MTFLEKMIAQFNRISGKEVSAESSEAELLHEMEGTQSMSEVMEGSETLKNLTSRISALEKQGTSSFVTQDSLDETLTSLNTSIAEVSKKVDSNADVISTAKTELSKEINAVKSTSSKSQTHTPDPTLKVEATENDGDKETMEVNMDKFFNGQIVKGLI